MKTSNQRTAQQKAIAKTEADVAWQDMYRKRANPKRLRSVLAKRLLRVTFTMRGRAYHPTKGYRGRPSAENG